MRWCAIGAGLLSACFPRGSDAGLDTDAVSEPPAITEVAAECDPEAGTWSISIATRGWAGGAVLLWTLDGAYVERHDGFRSVQAAQDGSTDVLQNTVGIVSDFRPAGNGRTAFTCRTAPSSLIWVQDLGGRPTDCWQFGTAPEPLLELEGVPDCPTRIDPPVETDDSDSDDTDAETDSDTDDSDPPSEG